MRSFAPSRFIESNVQEEARKARRAGLFRSADLAEFYPLWYAEESEHGRALTFLADSAGVPPAEVRKRGTKDHLRRAFSPLGMTLCRVLPGSQRGLMAAAAAAEYVTREFYLELARQATAPAVQALFHELARQEGRHLKFFLSAAKQSQLPDRISLAVVRWLLRGYWRPVGLDRLGQERWLDLFRDFLEKEDFRVRLRRMDSVLDALPGIQGLGLMSRFLDQNCPAEQASSGAEHVVAR